jgi:CheY-like chemotaxis protein
MTTESTQPPSEVVQAQAAVPGQSQGHRRRRRRRKTKANLASAQNGQAPLQPQNGMPGPSQSGQLQNGQPPVVAGIPAPPTFQPRPAQSQQQGMSGQGSGRKKKKKRRGGGGGANGEPNDGQLAFLPREGSGMGGNGGGGKKRRQQKGPRQFVGPMDHSYRAVNGNVADGPPSTIPFGGNIHNGSYYNEAPRTAVPAIAEDAQSRIFLFIEDLFFRAKIQEASRKLGVKVEFVKGDDKETIARIAEQASVEHPTLLVFDLNNTGAKPLTLIPKFKTKLKRAVSIIGFLSHLQGDLKAKATEAGCDTVMPRSAFSQSLPNLLRRYGMEDDDDNYPQPV